MTSENSTEPFTDINAIENFNDFNLSADLLKALEKMNFSSPTPIQKATIPMLLTQNQDFIGLASTGTGKTAAFGIPLIEKIDTSEREIQALILCPTRELCLQVADQIQKLGEFKGIKSLSIIGGDSYRKQKEGLKKNPHIIISTPGRLIDLLEQGAMDLSSIKYLVLDEADEMISIGFREALNQILSAIRSEELISEEDQTPKNKIWLFSATMSSDVRKVANTYLQDHGSVQINKETPLSGTIEQIYYTVMDKNKLEALSRILAVTHPFYGIIFCQTKQEVADVTALLQKRNFDVDCLHGDKQQREREWILKKFKNRELTVIVATDVAARGLDIKDLTHVINYNLPWDTESYIHRIGRTGRNGQTGKALSLVSPRELRQLRRIQTVTKSLLQKGEIPTSEQVATYKLGQLFDKMMKEDLSLKKLDLLEDLMSEVQERLHIKLSSETTKMLSRWVLTYYPELTPDKEVFIDFSPGRIPDEMMDKGGGGAKRSGGSGRGGDRGGRSDRGDRGGSRFGGRRRDSRGGEGEDRPPRRERSSDDRGSRSGSGERRERSHSGPRYNMSEEYSENRSRGGDRPRRFDSERGERSERSGDRPPRKDHPGIKRHRKRD